MKLVTFSDSTGARLGALSADGQSVIDLAASGLPKNMTSFIAMGDEGLKTAAAALESGENALPVSGVTLLAPIPRPVRNVFCVGKNYYEHSKEFHNSGFDASAGKNAIPDVPIFFTKPPSSVIGPGVPIPAYLDTSHATDYEGELAVVIGTGGRGISKEDTFDHVYGYTIVNDVTARHLQGLHRQWFIGKSLDGYCPMGPTLVTADDVPDVGKLRLVTRVNGDVRQDALISDLIFDIPTLIETASAGITLEPGDIIATGTPAGVGIGFDPPVYLKSGDRVSITIEPIGELSNTVDAG
ncbi:MAG: fumarylacetoacetate hydrolase family protein [Proteobacteria bacterium]|nr:fumarylacetoacetate hydrolase family protein [Pseudomonadota bacterium]